MIKVLCVGRIKEKYLSDAIDEYLKRITKYTKIEIIELEDINKDNIEIIKKLEGKNILKNVKDRDYVITLEIDGNMLSSEELSKKIENTMINNSNIVFVIGGSYGISDEVKLRSDYKLSFSKLTFPHQLFRVILLEQLYRSYKIINNESYHK